MSRWNDTPPDPQNTGGAQADSALDTDILASTDTVDKQADDLARKGYETEKSNESDDTVGGVRANSGGIFSK